MRRLLSRVVWDARLQLRNGFYYAAGAVVVFLTGLLVWVPPDWMPWLLPFVLFANLATNGFYFMAGLVLLEKAEHSLDAQVVTPLRAWEYLLAKVATLALASLVESAAIVAVAYGSSTDWSVFAAGVTTMTATLAACGFLLAARYDSINEFLFPSFLVTTVLALPLLDLLPATSSPWWYLHPLHPGLILVRAAFDSFPPGALLGASSLAVAWAAAAFLACVRGFHRFVVTVAVRA